MIILVLSGGQDSTVASFKAVAEFKHEPAYAITFNYGQKHCRELQCAQKIAELANVPHEIIEIGPLRGSSPLVSNTDLGQYRSPAELPGGVEPTFVPGRNLVFFTYAANYGLSKGLKVQEGEKLRIVSGVCQADYGGYPDCRIDFLNSAQNTLNLAVFGKASPDYEESSIIFYAPLLLRTKAETVALAVKLGILPYLAETHTCYKGTEIPCRSCHACIIRERGFVEAKVIDPLIQKLQLDWPPKWALREVEEHEDRT